MVTGNLGAPNFGAAMVYPAETFDAAATLKACADERVGGTNFGRETAVDELGLAAAAAIATA
jgi:hypothetical protein